MNYPKIIHQTYKTTNLPEHWKISKLKWKEFHPDYTYMFWTDEDIREYIKTNYPQYLHIHDNYKYNIQRADMIRYFILYDFGGIYCDLDLYPIENIEKHLLNYNSDVLLCQSGNFEGHITNSFMISKKGASIWLSVHKQLTKKKPIYAIGKHLTVMYTTGPNMLTMVIKKNITKNSINILPSEKFMAYSSNEDFNTMKKGVVLMPLKGKSWNGIDSHIFNLLNNYKNELTGLLINENLENKLSHSIYDKYVINKNATRNISLYVSGCNEGIIENIKNTNIITYEFPTKDEKDVIIHFNHGDGDGYLIIQLLTGVYFPDKTNDDEKFKNYILLPINSINILTTYMNNISTTRFLNTPNTLLVYEYLATPINHVKKLMKDYNMPHTSSFLFTILCYSFWKKTNAAFIKCANIYAIPQIKGINKLINWIFIVKIQHNQNNLSVFKNIYEQIYSNNKTIDQMWGLHTALNIFYESNQKFLHIPFQDESNNNTKDLDVYSPDIVFSNIICKLPCEIVKCINKSNNEKMYACCLGNHFDEFMISLVYDQSLSGIENIFNETITKPS